MMTALKTEEVRYTGIKHIEEWLYSNGFINIFNNTEETGINSIAADGNIEHILVLVKTLLRSGMPDS